ncbi:transcription elongation factor spt4 [Vermiconidia calcicola]|uniref:Transcription elongation factor spt4 n=1 Tax=Vermiconidia calcicola TaxID=1690605 RepID=A0ACC3MIF6_9PEZI|nr:transcription elongation factor spt4 [Vermiconidia calcicola]
MSRSLRACMVCSFVQLGSKFQSQGCPNCEEFLEMRGSSETVNECTSQVFEGMIVLNGHDRSWVAKWQRLEGYQPGTYAVKVVGTLPEDFIAAAENAGVKYVPRDGSGATDEQ